MLKSKWNIFKRVRELEAQVESLKDSLNNHKRDMKLEFYSGPVTWYSKSTTVDVVKVVKMLIKHQGLQLSEEPGKSAQIVFTKAE